MPKVINLLQLTYELFYIFIYLKYFIQEYVDQVKSKWNKGLSEIKVKSISKSYVSLKEKYKSDDCDMLNCNDYEKCEKFLPFIMFLCKKM